MAETTVSQREAYAVSLGLGREIAPNSARMDALQKEVEAQRGKEALEGLHGFPGHGSREETSKKILYTDVEKGGREARGGIGGVEEIRKQEVDRQTSLYLKFIKEGYENMSVPERTDFRNQMLEAINRNPNLQKVFGEVNFGAQTRTLDDLMKDEDIRTALAEVLGNAYSQDTVKTATEIEKRLLDASGEVRKKKAEEQALQNEKTTQETKKTELTSELDKFKNDSDPAYGLKSKQTRLDEVQGSQKVVDYLRKAENVKILQEHSKTDKSNDAKEALRLARVDLVNAQTDDEVKDYIRLATEKLQLEGRITENAKRLSELTIQIPGKEAERIAAQHGYDTALSEREALAKNFEMEVKSAVQDATENVLVKRARQVSGKPSEALANVTSEVDKKATDKLREHVAKRWDQKYRRGPFGKEGLQLNKELAAADYQSLMDGGPSELAKRIIDSDNDLTTEEKEHLKKNSDFLASYGVDLAEKTLSQYLTTGGNFEKDAEVLCQKEWAEPAFQKWVENDPQAKALIDKLKATNKSSGKLEDLRKKFGNKWLIGFLMLLLGVVAWTVAGPMVMGAAGAAGGELMNILNSAKDNAGKGLMGVRVGAGVLGAHVGSRAGDYIGDAAQVVSPADSAHAAGEVVKGVAEQSAPMGDQLGSAAQQALQTGMEQASQVDGDALKKDTITGGINLLDNMDNALGAIKDTAVANPTQAVVLGGATAAAVNRIRK